MTYRDSVMDWPEDANKKKCKKKLYNLKWIWGLTYKGSVMDWPEDAIE